MMGLAKWIGEAIRSTGTSYSPAAAALLSWHSTAALLSRVAHRAFSSEKIDRRFGQVIGKIGRRADQIDGYTGTSKVRGRPGRQRRRPLGCALTWPPLLCWDGAGPQMKLNGI